MGRKRGTKTVDEPKVEVIPKVDERLVGEAVIEIRSILNQTLHRAVTGVGDYVLRNFFDGDPARVSSKDPTKATSFRALTERCGEDLPVSRAWLHAAVRVAVLRKALPADAVFRALPPSHQTAIAPIRDPELAEKLAKRALERALTVREVKAAVRKEQDRAHLQGEARGRPPTPTIRKVLDRAARALQLDEGKRFNKAMVEALGGDGVALAIHDAKSLIARLEGLVEKLEGGAH